MTEYLYGRNPIYESLIAGRRKPVRLSLEKGTQIKKTVKKIVDLCEGNKISFDFVSSYEIEKLSGCQHTQGVVLESSRYPYVEVDNILNLAEEKNEDVFLLLLDLLQDPQNVGTLLRTADAVGVHGVVFQDRRSVGITPSVVNSSSGAVEHLLVSQVSNLNNTILNLKKKHIWFYGLEGNEKTPSCFETNLTGPVGLVVGNEGEGLRDLIKKNCDGLIGLPMKGKVESLNAAVAGSVVLYEVWKQRGF